MRKLFIYIITLTFLLSCQEKGRDVINEWPWENSTSPEDSEHFLDQNATLDKWSDVSSQFGSLPSYIRVYKSPSFLEGKASVAYIAVADMSYAEWDVWSVKSDDSYSTRDAYKTPSQVYGAEKWPIVINGGFFYSYDGVNYTSSLAVSNSQVLAYNINYASEDWVKIYFPTRAVFLEDEGGDFDACWTYFKSSSAHYKYAKPALNSWDKSPLAQPSSEGAEDFAAKTAIGGGPVLIDSGVFTDSYVAELFNGKSGIRPDSDQPRTAIGITSDAKMIFFVCEGRGMTEGVYGLTTADVANVLLDLDCVEAINLDGGGSSCMLVNGKHTIKVSDGSERSVASTVMLK